MCVPGKGNNNCTGKFVLGVFKKQVFQGQEKRKVKDDIGS